MEREYIGIDLHKAFFHVCAITSTGERRWEQRWPTSDAGIAAFVDRCGPHSQLAVEASSPTWAFVDRVVGQVGVLASTATAVSLEQRATNAAKPAGVRGHRLSHSRVPSLAIAHT